MYRYTLFNTPLLTPLFYWIARGFLWATGWCVCGLPPAERKFIVIAYPHTSNWDAVYTLAISLVFRLRIYWMAKSSLFVGPFGPIMKWLGGIPVYLGERRDTVQQMIRKFEDSDELIVVIAPEANRSFVNSWKTGFYHMAVGAGVPIVLGFLDFEHREGGYLKTFSASGDLERDLASIRHEYRGIKGKYPEQSVY